MSDREVEDTLREIRERVMAESALGVAEPQPAAAGARVQESATGNGTAHAAYANGRESLARLQANLATTERAWSRLPPLVSNRRGWAAQLELWMKRQIKRATHWFTWEQVNFNSAVHHALGDARDALGDARDALGDARDDARVALGDTRDALARARSDNASLRELFERLSSEAEADRESAAELRARLAAAESRFDSGLIGLRDALADGVERLRAEQRSLADGLRAEQRSLADDLRAERDARIHTREEQFQTEMRERIEHLLEEQRVCFKQLSLEAGESATTLDRARRQIEARVEALEEKRGER